MKSMIPVKDVSGLARDSNGVIHNVDKTGYDNYVSHRDKILSEKQRIEKLETDVHEIKDSLALMLKLLQGKDNAKD